jgi:hypothetical protein
MPVPYIDPKTGEYSHYRTVAERLPQFLARFPIEDGWSVRREIVPFPFSEKTFELLRLCIERGVSPETYGLSPPPSQVSVVARLYDSRDVLRASATSFGVIAELKDVETIETAALGRLMASVGIAGSVQELEEALVESNVETAKAHPPKVVSIKDRPAPAAPVARPVVEPAPVAQPVVEPAPVAQPDVASAPVAQPVVEPAPVAQPDVASAPVAQPVVESAPVARQPIPMTITTQIEAVARSKGVTPPSYSDVTEAKAVLRQLRAM